MARVPVVGPGNTKLTSDDSGKTHVNPQIASLGGANIESIGNVASDIFGQFEKAQAIAEQTEAENYYKTEIYKLKNKRAQDDNTSSENHKRYHEDLSNILKNASQKISIPQYRGEFEKSTGSLSIIDKIELDNVVVKKISKNAIRNMNQFLQSQYNDYASTDNPKLRALAEERRDKKIKQMYESGFIDKETMNNLLAKAPQTWDVESATRDAYTDPQKFYKRLDNGFYKHLPSKDAVTLKESAARTEAKIKESAIKQTALQQNKDESLAVAAVINGDNPIDAINNPNWNLSTDFKEIMKLQANANFAKESDSGAIDKIMNEYAGIFNKSDPEKSMSLLRKNILLNKAKLSESHYKQLLTLTTDPSLVQMPQEKNNAFVESLKQVWNFYKSVQKSKIDGVRMVVDFVSRAVTSDSKSIKKAQGEAIQSQTPQYKIGDVVSKAGRKFKVVSNDNGSFGFEEIS